MIRTNSGLIIETKYPEKVFQKKDKVVITDPQAILDLSGVGEDGIILNVGKKKYRIKYEP